MSSQPASRWWSLITLIIAGESIFFLPFVLTRIFRVTYLDVLGIDNTQLGNCFTAYGIVALVSYLLGGPLADKFSPRYLMTLALVSTGASGFLLAQVPSYNTLILLYAFWGLSTILLFWSPLLRATREAGGAGGSNMAFGLLDGGRGLSAALIATSAVSIFSALMPDVGHHVTDAERAAAFAQVVRYFSWFVIGAGAVVFITLRPRQKEKTGPQFEYKDLAKVARIPQVWWQAAIVVCAYSGYRVTDGFPQFAQDYLDLTEQAAAAYSSQALWLRPLATVGAGVLATMFTTSRMVQWMFLWMLGGSVMIGTGGVAVGDWVVFGGTLTCVACSMYALRGLYYAILEEGRIPWAVTGTAVGLVSIIGYLPDIYMARFMGYFYDTYPGITGHQYTFWMLAAFSAVGLLATVGFRRSVRVA